MSNRFVAPLALLALALSTGCTAIIGERRTPEADGAGERDLAPGSPDLFSGDGSGADLAGRDASPPPDLPGADLASADLASADLASADLAGADQGGCNPMSTLSCGGCGNVCMLQGASGAMCNGSQCSYICTGTSRDCVKAGANTDGCETDIATSTLHCAGCGNSCALVGASSASCDGTKCNYTCTGTRRDCVSAPPNIDGCETDIATSTSHCAGCGNRCDTIRSSGAGCNGSSCTYSGCQAGFKDCVTTAPDTDGCETDVTTALNCGDCGVRCDTTQSNGASCSGSTCAYSGCRPGFADCSAAAPDTDGCETPTTTTANCGGCGNVCDSTNSTGAGCNGTSCTYTGCKAGFIDCNPSGVNTNGCECAGTFCCGSSCAPRHLNCSGGSCMTVAPALGQSFYATTNGQQCSPLGNYTTELAADARTAWPGAPINLCTITCADGSQGRAKETSTGCVSWFYSGPLLGKVHFANLSGGAPCAKCDCPTSPATATGSWN